MLITVDLPLRFAKYCSKLETIQYLLTGKHVNNVFSLHFSLFTIGRTSSVNTPIFEDKPDVFYRFSSRNNVRTTVTPSTPTSKHSSKHPPSSSRSGSSHYSSLTLSPNIRRNRSHPGSRSHPGGRSSSASPTPYSSLTFSPKLRRRSRSPLAIQTSPVHSSLVSSLNSGSPLVHSASYGIGSPPISSLSSSFSVSIDAGKLDSLSSTVSTDDIILDECLNTIAQYAPDPIAGALLKRLVITLNC